MTVHPTIPPEPSLELGADDLTQLSATFSPPRWLRDLGRASWLLAGVLIVLGGLIWLLGATGQIVDPVTAALIVAVVVSPLVRLLQRHMPRTAAAAVVLLSAIAIAVVIVLLVVSGITSQGGAIGSSSTSATNKIGSWLGSLGLDDTAAANVNRRCARRSPT